MSEFIKEFEGQDLVEDEKIVSFLCKSPSINNVSAKTREEQLIKYFKIGKPANRNISN